MDASLYGFLAALVVTALLVFPLARPLRTHPSIFYAAALVLTALYVWALWTGVNLTPVRALTVVLQKGYLASLLLGVVMFTGCLDESSSLRRHLQPIRGELSILSFVFILGHLLTYLPGYLGRFGALLTTRTNVALSLIIAMILTVLFGVLTITSLRWLHKRMGTKSWKNLQRFSYLMVALFAVHVGLALGRSAFASAPSEATTSFVLYLVIVAAYAVLRIRKAVRDSKKRPAAA